MKLIHIFIAVVVSFVIGAAVARYYYPRIEMKQVEVTKEVVRNDIRTVTRMVERPDGSKETVVEVVDKSTKKETSTKETTVASKKDWVISVSTDYNYRDYQQSYELQVQRRILGPFYIGAKASTNQSVGAMVGFEF